MKFICSPSADVYEYMCINCGARKTKYKPHKDKTDYCSECYYLKDKSNKYGKLAFRTIQNEKEITMTNSRLTGFLSGGQWNKDTRKFEVGKFKAGDSFGIKLALGVSKKDKQSGNRTYGASIPVTMWLDNKEQFQDVMKKIESLVVIEGYFTPNNWEKDGKEVKGNQFNCNYTDLFVESEYSGGTPAPKTEVPVIEIDEDEIPF